MGGITSLNPNAEAVFIDNVTDGSTKKRQRQLGATLGTREPWGTLGKLREYKGIMGITRLPTPLGPSPLKDILTWALGAEWLGSSGLGSWVWGFSI